ncbi:MAG: hypothetical protein U0746_09445 [Gemmataceae bacterium]
MTATATELEAPVRDLIDGRLDAVDRVLLHAGTPRSERREIVGEVEAQIFEMLARRGDAPARADVLAVLSQLDPPESYAPDGFDVREFRTAWAANEPAGPRVSALAVCGAAAGVLDAFFVVAALGLLFVGGEEAALLAIVPGALFAMAATVLGGLAVLRIRESNGRLTGMPAAAYAAIQLPLLMSNALAVAAFLLGGEYALIALAGLMLLAWNVAVPLAAWKFTRRGTTA